MLFSCSNSLIHSEAHGSRCFKFQVLFLEDIFSKYRYHINSDFSSGS